MSATTDFRWASTESRSSCASTTRAMIVRTSVSAPPRPSRSASSDTSSPTTAASTNEPLSTRACTRATRTRTRRSSVSSPRRARASSVRATESMGRSSMRERMTRVASRTARAPGCWAVPGWSSRSRSRSIARIGSPATVAAREAPRVTSSRSGSFSSSHDRARSKWSSASCGPPTAIAESGVAEGVGRGPARLEDVMLDSRGQGRLEALVGEVDDPGEEVVADELTALEGDGAQHALRGVVELLDPRAEHAAQTPGQRLTGGGARNELLREERVALRSPGDLGRRVGIEGGTFDAGDELSDGVVGERGELDVLEPRDARPHGEGLVQGVAAVEVVGAVGHDETDGRGEAPGQQKGDEVARGVVGPVDVLDDDEGGLRVAEGGEQGVDGLGDLARVGGPSRLLGVLAVRHVDSAGQQVPEDRVRQEHALDDVRATGVDRAHELDEGEVRETAAGLADAVADRGEPAGAGGVGDELRDDPRLADAGVARQHDDATALGPRDGAQPDGVGETGQVGVPADERARAQRHTRHHRV